MPKSTVQRIASTVCQNLGFLPTSNSTKPVHIANGLFRECTGASCDISDIHSWIISERRGGDKIISSKDLIAKYHSILSNGPDEDPEQIKAFRFLLEEVFNSDKAAYPSYHPSVLNISSHWLVRNYVKSEATIGRFLFDILSQELSGKSSPVLKLISSSLSEDKDDITKLIKPILTSTNKTRKNNTTPENRVIDLNKCKHTIRQGFDQLTENLLFTGQSNNTLLTLQRIVNYSVFSVLYYLMNINSVEFTGKPVPLLLDMGGGLQAIEDASVECFILGKKTVEEYFVNCIEKILLEEIGNSREECTARIQDMPLDNNNDEIRSAISRFYESFCTEGETPIMALARAMQIVVYTFQYKNNTPSDFCRVLGVKCGFVGPSGNAVKKKRLLINRFTFETIVLSALTQEELRDGIELKDLGERLRNMYTILIGSDVEADYGLLKSANIAQSTPGNLRGELSINARLSADMLSSMGLAKKYADGVTIVGWGL